MRAVVDTDARTVVRDGVELAADLYLPEGRGPFPTLLQRVPYNRRSPRIANLAVDVFRAVAAGYAVVAQDVRGRFGSEGTFTPFLDDAADGADTVEWIASQPWSDGNVGMIGASYAGLAQWAAASTRTPALKAIAPFSAPDDHFDRWIYRDGVFELGFDLHWTLRNVAVAEAARHRPSDVAALLAANDAIDHLYRRLPLTDVEELASIAPFYGEWLAEPTPGGRWGGPPLAEAADVPAVVVGGWYDVFQRGSLDSFDRLTTPKSLVIGPWTHGVYTGVFEERSFGVAADADIVDLTALQLRFLDRWVRGIDNGVDRELPVRVFATGADYWRAEASWPPADAEPTTWFLREGAALARSGPAREEADTFVYDPASPVPTVGGAVLLPGVQIAANAGPRDQRRVEARADVLCYTSDPLRAPVEVAGRVAAEVFLSSTAPDLDLAVTLSDVGADGVSLPVADGVVRARYRDSRVAPSLLTRGRVYQVVVDLGGAAHVFRRGHRLRVTLTGGSFPRFEPNLQTGALAAESNKVAAATHRIHHEPGHESRVVLPVVDRVETRERLTSA